MTNLISELVDVVVILLLCFISVYCFIQVYELNKPRKNKTKKVNYIKCEDFYLEEKYFIEDIPSAKSRLGELHFKYHSDLFDKEDVK